VKHDGSERPEPTIPAAPSGAAGVFGSRLALAVRFTEILADTGVSHGLIGPREVPRLWDRHVLNCAVVHDAFPADARLVDVGSGAGLPGVALAIARPDLEVHLVEPMLRRTQWLSSVLDELGLDNVTVHRGRAEELVGVVSAPWVTARAVARLDKLARWCVPLLEDDGTLVAMKGRSAAEELAEDRRALERLGLVSAEVTSHGGEVLEEPVLTVDLRFRPRSAASGASGTRRKGGGTGKGVGAGKGRKGAVGRAGRARRAGGGPGSARAVAPPSP
jgi:16S rRNA (guanine527-N7)-methyltransferase